jgi:competence ComEA-like helix-hairpin-helix protein
MWKDYFSFNKRQRNGIIVLLSLILILLTCLIISNHMVPSQGNLDLANFKAEIAGVNNSRLTKNTSSDSVNATNNHLKATGEEGKILLNECSIKELSRNPNIGYYLAEAIVNYRELHGPYKKVEDLKNSKAVDDSTYNKIAPYFIIK